MDKKMIFYDAMLYTMEGENPSRAFENQEKREQVRTVRNSRLPKKTNEHSVPNEYRFNGITDSMMYEERRKIVDENNYRYTKQQYERMGIKIVEEYDDLFYTVELPDGWEIKPTDHSMWNDVIDSKGRKRISFFYKGVFYDRDAFSNFENRYSFTILPFDEYKSDATYEERKFKPWRLFITDCGQKIKKIMETVVETNDEYLQLDDTLRLEGKHYLDAAYPQWEDINSYWD